MIDEINSTELHTCLLEITLLPLAHYWDFWYGPLDAAIYGSFILGGQSMRTVAEVNEQLRRRRMETVEERREKMRKRH